MPRPSLEPTSEPNTAGGLTGSAARDRFGPPSQSGDLDANTGKVAPQTSAFDSKAHASMFGSESMLGALREMDATGFSAVEILRSRNQRAMPAGWMRLAWYKRPFVMAWLFSRVMWDYARRIAWGARWALQAWLRKRPGLLGQIAEVVLWPAFFVYLAWVSNTGNPFYINEGFPWPWLGVWLIAMRYGALSGVGAGLLLLLAWYLIAPDPSFPRLYFLGGAIMALIAGEFGSLWGARSARFYEASAYQDDKIERLTRRLYLLKLSHDELEYELVDRPGTLRDALLELRGLLEQQSNAQTGKNLTLPGAQPMLDFLSQYCQIEVGALYEYLDGPKPRIQRLAHIGSTNKADIDDPMIVRAIEAGQSVHLQEMLMDKSRKSELIFAAPLRDKDNRVVGILTINRMPFMALNPDNLRNIWVLLQSYVEYLRLSTFAATYTLAWPESPPELRQEFAWLQRLQIDFGLQSSCVVWRCQHEQQLPILRLIRQQHSNGEMAWAWTRGSTPAIVTLLPFMGTAQVQLTQKRIEKLIARQYGDEVVQNHLSAIEIPLAKSDAWQLVRRMLESRL